MKLSFSINIQFNHPLLSRIITLFPFFTITLAQVHPLLDKVRKMSRTFRVTRFYALTHL